MADRQIEEVLAQMMSLSNYDEHKFIQITSASSERTLSMVSEESNSENILYDS